MSTCIHPPPEAHVCAVCGVRDNRYVTCGYSHSGAGAKIACPYHPDAVLIDDSHAGDMICPDCGLVVADRVIDVSAEWRTFRDATKGMSRVGPAEVSPSAI